MWETSGAVTVPDQISESCVPSRARTFKSQSPSLRLFPQFARYKHKVSSSSSGRTRRSPAPFTRGKGEISFQGFMLITLPTSSNLHPGGKPNSHKCLPSVQLCTPAQLLFWVINMDIGLQPGALEMANCSVDAKAGLGLRSGRREKPALPIDELDITVLDMRRGEMGLCI